jgi:hypothetical protein
MWHTRNSLLSVTVAITTFAVVVAVVEHAPLSQAAHSVDLTPEQVRGAYLNAAHLVSPLMTSDDGVITFSVSNPSDALWQNPVLRVSVYTSTAAAVAAHQRASSGNEADRSGAYADGDDRGPPLLTGYGLSVWRQNVSVIQAAPAEDVGAWPVEVDCANNLSSQQVVLPRTIVEPQYVVPLQALLGSPPSSGR